MQDIDEVRSPLSYDMLYFRDPNAMEYFKAAIDPEKKLTKFKAVIADSSVWGFYWRNFVKNIEAAEDYERLYKELLRSYQKFKRTGVLKNVAVSFEPDENEGVLKVIFSPQYHKKVDFGAHLVSLSTEARDTIRWTGHLAFTNLFGLFETTEFGLEGTITGKPMKGTYFNLRVPEVYKNWTMNFTSRSSRMGMTSSLTEKRQGQVLSLQTPRITLSFINILRNNEFNRLLHSREILEEDCMPSRKLSVRVEKKWKFFGRNRSWLSLANLSGEFGHVEGSGKIGRVFLNNFYVGQPESWHLYKKWKNLVFTNASSFGAVLPIKESRILLNDRFYKNSMIGFSDLMNPETTYDQALHPLAGNPGFEYLGDYKGDDICLTNTLKMKFSDCPILKNLHLTPYLYWSYGYFSGDVVNGWMKKKAHSVDQSPQVRRMNLKKKLWEEIKAKSRTSVGVGVEAQLKNNISLSACLNLFMIGKPSDKFQTFQFRISANS